MKLAFVGGGTMAEAVISGVLDHGITESSNLTVGEPLETRQTYLINRYNVDSVTHNTDAIADAPLVILAVKPQALPAVMPELRDALTADQTVLSIMAGVKMDTLVRGLEHHDVIRVMPNTPAQVGAGMSIWTASLTVSEEMLELTRSILQALGEEIYVPDEHLLDIATAINGSGPAYVFQFIEALIDAGVYLGMPRDMTRSVVLQTILGSTLLMKQTGKHPSELRDLVTSPGGTTAEALLVLEGQGFAAGIVQAVKAAYAKSRGLGAE